MSWFCYYTTVTAGVTIRDTWVKGTCDLFVLLFATSHEKAEDHCEVQRRWQATQTERTLCIKANRYRILGSEKTTK